MAWTDERLDDLAGRMDAGFARVDAELAQLRGEMNSGFRELRADIDTLRGMMFRFMLVLAVGLIGVIATLAGTLAAGGIGA